MMKTIGLIGGISWVSTIDYYRIINSTVNARLGGNESAKIILHSVNYAEIVSLTYKGDWDGIAAIITVAAQNVERSGANCLLLCANTMHQIAERIQAAISIPIIHVADITAKAVSDKKISKVLLLGTRYTMAAPFYPQRLKQRGIEMVVPEQEDIEFVNNSIYNEMGQGIFLPETKKTYLDIIEKHRAKGVGGVVLGCTEIPQLLKQDECPIPVFDTTSLHATAAVDFALS